MDFRIGFGWDSHAFAPGVPLLLGGLKIDHPEGLAGHSDGDVLLHAVTDALLGAVAAGDIGAFFPPSDPRWKGADSSIFVRLALDEVRNAGFRIGNIDITLILKAPKIGPLSADIRERVAELLEVDLGKVSVKAKTPEGLNLDHVAQCHAVVLVQRPPEPVDLKELESEIDVDAPVDAVVQGLLDSVHGSNLSKAIRPIYDTDDIT